MTALVSRREGCLQRIGRHGVGDRIDVDQHRCCACLSDGRNGGYRGVRHGNHLVAGAHVAGKQRQVQSIGS